MLGPGDIAREYTKIKIRASSHAEDLLHSKGKCDKKERLLWRASLMNPQVVLLVHRVSEWEVRRKIEQALGLPPISHPNTRRCPSLADMPILVSESDSSCGVDLCFPTGRCYPITIKCLWNPWTKMEDGSWSSNEFVHPALYGRGCYVKHTASTIGKKYKIPLALYCAKVFVENQTMQEDRIEFTIRHRTQRERVRISHWVTTPEYHYRFSDAFWRQQGLVGFSGFTLNGNQNDNE